MITKKSRPRHYSRVKNNKGMANNEQTSTFEPPRHENAKASRPQNGYRNYQHLFDKYTNLAREALSCGDRIAAEFHYQHADHYLRLLNERQSHRSYAQPTDRNYSQPAAVDRPPENDIESITE